MCTKLKKKCVDSNKESLTLFSSNIHFTDTQKGKDLYIHVEYWMLDHHIDYDTIKMEYSFY